MKEYEVSWTIELTAEDVADAAKQAYKIMLDPESVATVFHVTVDGKTEVIDVHPERP